MSIRINSVSVTPTETTVGEPIVVVISAEEIEWGNLRADFTDWGEVRRSFTNWNMVKNYIYTKQNPTPDSNVVRSSDNFALFDVDANQISIKGGYTSAYSAETIRDFVGEVMNG